VIKKFRHKGLETFFTSGSVAGIQAKHKTKLRVQLTMLNVATRPGDMNAPGWKLHPLHGDREGQWAVQVNGNWRLIFEFEGQDATLVDYDDYH